MVRSTVDYYAFTVKTRKKNPDIPRDVLDVGGGYSVLAYLCSYLEHVKGTILKDERRERIYSVSDYEVHGRLVLIDVLSGQYGESGQLLDILRGNVVRDINPDEAAVKTVRIVFCCPRGDDVKMAIFAVEHMNSINGKFVIDYFAKCLRAFIPGLVAKIDGILEKEAWLDSSSLVSMKIPISSTDQQLTVDNGLDDDPKETMYGRMALVVLPPKGVSVLNPRFWRALRKKNMGREGMLTIPSLNNESIPKQGVLVEAAGIDGRKKTFTIGNEKSPKIREVITGDGEPLWVIDGVPMQGSTADMPNSSEIQLRRVLSDSIFRKYHDEQIRLETGWDSGEMHEEIPDSEVIDWNTLFEQVNPQNGDRYELES